MGVFLFRSLRSRHTRKTIEREGARRPAAAPGAHTSVTARGHATLIASSLRCTLLDVRIDARPRGKGPACSNVRSAIKDVDDAGKLEHVEYEHCDGERTCNHGHREPSRAIKGHQGPSRAIKSHSYIRARLGSSACTSASMRPVGPRESTVGKRSLGRAATATCPRAHRDSVQGREP